WCKGVLVSSDSNSSSRLVGPHKLYLALAMRVQFSDSSGDHRDLNSFPTRRSSDLRQPHPGGAVGHPAPQICPHPVPVPHPPDPRSEEHTSELQSRENLVCRLLLEKKKYHSTSLHICPIDLYGQAYYQVTTLK